jgi:hypothetical protein
LFTQRANSGRTQQQHCLSQQQQNISGERKAPQMQAEWSPSGKTIGVCSNEAASKEQAKKTEAGRQASKQAALCAPNPNSRSSKNVEISNSSPLDETMERGQSKHNEGWMDG